MNKVAIFHTSGATLATMKQLCSEYMSAVPVMHIVEESMISEVMRSGGVTAAISSRILGYAQVAERAGCSIFMTACSSIGYAVEQCQPFTSMKMRRIDTAMIEQALELGRRIAVMATVKTTLEPTVDYIQRLAAKREHSIELSTFLKPDAFTALLDGDKATHDSIVRGTLDEALSGHDVIILAQASMAQALPADAEFAIPVLTSPVSGIQALATEAMGLPE